MDVREKGRPAGETAGSPGDSAKLNVLPPEGVQVTARLVQTNGADSAPANAISPKGLLYHAHPYPGRLIAVEGIDGSGKSTQLLLLERWLRTRGHPVHFTEWNSSRLVRR